jgi:hypothetical protein
MNRLTCAALIAAFAASLATLVHADSTHDHASIRGDSPLVAKVRAATQRYEDIRVAIAEGWVQGTPLRSAGVL